MCVFVLRKDAKEKSLINKWIYISSQRRRSGVEWRGDEGKNKTMAWCCVIAHTNWQHRCCYNFFPSFIHWAYRLHVIKFLMHFVITFVILHKKWCLSPPSGKNVALKLWERRFLRFIGWSKLIINLFSVWRLKMEILRAILALFYG